MGELERHARSAEILVRVGAARLFGIEHRQCLRDTLGDRLLARGQVVVRDDAVYAQLAGSLDHGKRANARIYADENGEAFVARPLDHFGPHPVAFPHPVRDVVIPQGGIGADQLQRGVENQDGHRAIRVIVAVNEDLLAALDGLEDAADGRLHAEHLKGIVQVGQFGREKPTSRCGIVHAAQSQQPRQQRRNSQLLRKVSDGRRADFA